MAAVRALTRVAALLVASLLGCASVPRPKQPFTDANQILGLHQLASERVRSIRAEARVDQRGSRGRIKGTVLMFVQRPARVRLDAMTQFGPAAILTSDGERFVYNDLRNRRFITGETCPKNIARFLNIALSVDQTTLLLLGGTPVIVHEAASIVWSDDGFYRISLRARGGARQEVDLGIDDANAPRARQGLRLLRSEIYDSQGHSQLRLSYGDYRALLLGSFHVAMPFLVRVEQPAAGADTLIRFKQIALDGDVPPEAFEQVPLPGMQEEVASCDP
jgi:hypothetical protein